MEEFTTSTKAIWVGLISNFFLAVAKLIVGLIGSSSALIAEGANSSSDLLVSIAMLTSVRIARQPRDKEHPYGHGKAETIAASVVGLSILFVALGIIYGAYVNLKFDNAITPGLITAYVALISIFIKEGLFRYTSNEAKLQHSIILQAAAADHRTDQLTAFTAFIGIVLARLGYPIFDTLTALLIGFLIVYTAYRVLKSSVYQLMDGQAEDHVVQKIIDSAMANQKVLKISEVRARLVGRGIYVDMTILMDPGATLHESHAITEEVEAAITREIPRVIGVVTHVEPYPEG